jgi:hypothetical protein
VPHRDVDKKDIPMKCTQIISIAMAILLAAAPVSVIAKSFSVPAVKTPCDANLAPVANDFASGWQAGYKEGWKEVRGQFTIPPIPPIPPVAPIGRTTYKDGYNLGLIAGMNAAKKK